MAQKGQLKLEYIMYHFMATHGQLYAHGRLYG